MNLKINIYFIMQKLFLLLSIIIVLPLSAERFTYDIVVYGATSAGVTAAIQAKCMGKSVILIHPGMHVGGMTSNGLGAADSNHHYLVGGLTDRFFHHMWLYYQNDDAWKFEDKHLMNDQQGNPHLDEHTMWLYEPHVAERIFKAMLKNREVPVLLNEKLNRADGVRKCGQNIVEIEMESGNVYEGKVFIDASYEGDLMACAGVSYLVGRESNSAYDETLNGIQSASTPTRYPLHIDPFVEKGNPESGLLPRVYSDSGGNNGDGDSAVQAYCFRLCLTKVPENRIMIEKPKDYDASEYELLFRAIESGASKFFKTSPLPNNKADCNNFGMVSIDYIGMSWEWAEADYETRQKIAASHEKWQKGLIWTLQNHARVPEKVKEIYAPWGLCKDEFIKNQHWPYELYVREARRMISSKVITEHTALNREAVNDSVGIASYSIDSHNMKYFVNDQNELSREGGIYVNVATSFGISYQTIVPKNEECQNLIVPVCLSASHVGYAPIRMEPVYMILGQSAATAAAIAINLGVNVQGVPYDLLRTQLLKDGQVLDVP